MLAIIGGSGLYQLDGLEMIEKKVVETPFGAPSAALVKGVYQGVDVVFLPRHGEHHHLLPGEINYRANIWALKTLGVNRVISVSAVGSLHKDIERGTLTIPKQYIDWTKGDRAHTFFGDGLVAHVSSAQPTCEALTADLLQAAKALQITLGSDTTYVCIEGPRFNTAAESKLLRHLGGDIVGMTNVPEVFLAREAQLSYCTIAVVTDYDSWQDDPNEHANVDSIMAVYGKNIKQVQALLTQLLSQSLSPRSSYCTDSLASALLTPLSALSVEQKALIKFLS